MESTIMAHMVFSLNRGPQYRPQYILVLFTWSPKKVPRILGNPRVEFSPSEAEGSRTLSPDLVARCGVP